MHEHETTAVRVQFSICDAFGDQLVTTVLLVMLLQLLEVRCLYAILLLLLSVQLNR